MADNRRYNSLNFDRKQGRAADPPKEVHALLAVFLDSKGSKLDISAESVGPIGAGVVRRHAERRYICLQHSTTHSLMR